MIALDNEVISTLENPVWFEDQYAVHNVKFKVLPQFRHQPKEINVWMHITPRPIYCDRGHYMLNVDAHIGLDNDDRFPRYFMDLERAKTEAMEFIRWRLKTMKYI